MVRVHPIQLPDMQGEAGVIHHGHEELFDELGVVAADLLSRNLKPKAQVRATTAVQATCTKASSRGATK